MADGSAPQILSKDEHSLNFSSFLIVGFCNSSAKSRFGIISLLTAPPANLFHVVKEPLRTTEVFYQKIYKQLKQNPFDILHILDFWPILNAL